MINKRIKISGLIIILIFIILSFSIVNSSVDYLNERKNTQSIFPRPSLVVSPIHIDNNWTETKATYDWCTGSGLYTDPYIIKNLIIDGIGLETCILIENSAFYFRIGNCTVFNSGLGNYTTNEYEAGIKLRNTRNGKIINNNCSGNNGVSIMLSDGCNYNTISGNSVSNNGQHGILLFNDCHNNLLFRNNISVNDFCGIYLIKDCKYNSISENNISENDNGIIIFDGCLENAFLDNRVENNNNSGIEVNHFCNYNNFSRNIIQNSGKCGINITSNCSNNLVYNNSFSRNLEHAIDDGINNYWNSSKIGNYWSNYLGIDWNDDGIGDTPFEIWGSAESKDFLPIWDDGYKTSLFICLIIISLITLGVGGITIFVLFKKRIIKDEKITYVGILLIILILFFLMSII